MKPSKRMLLCLLFCVCSSTLLSGCWDQREIEERISVVAIGIDRDEKDPERISVTVQIPIPIKIAGSTGRGGGGGGDPVKVMSATGRTMVEAFNNLQRRLNQQLFYGHTRVIAIGEEMARSGLEDVLDVFRRDPQIRRLLWPLIVKGRAVELLQSKPELEQIPTVFMMSVVQNGARLGQIPDENLGSFFIRLSSKSEQPYLNYLQAGKTGVKWLGIAVFKEGRMIGTLDELQTWSFMRVAKEQSGSPIVFPFKGDPKKLISFSMDVYRVDERYRWSDGRVKADFVVSLEGDLIGKTFDSDFSDLGQIAELERAAAAYLEEESRKMLNTLQQEYDSDILGIGSKLRAYHPRIWKQARDTDYFADAEITVKYDVELRRTGMEMK